jgi:hypothetical protein
MMLRIRILALLCALSAFAGGLVARAATDAHTFLPIARSAPPATTCSPTAPLLDQDTGSLSAGLDTNGNFIVAYQDRAHGGRGVVAQHIGDHLVGLPAPAPAIVGTAPQFSPPDSVKVGAVALVLNSVPRRLYFTQRRPGDLTGPYGIWCLEF